MNTKIIEINPRELKPLELNARYMAHEEYKRLVDNVRKDGKLTSIPFACLEEDGKYLILSGNHRTKAAIDAGLEVISVLVTDDPLSEEQKIAIQLSHNSISGQDDPAILKELYEKITDIDYKKYSGLDDKTLGLLDKVSLASISEANVEFQTLSMVFLPDEIEHAKKVIDEAIKEVKSSNQIWLSKMSNYDEWLDAQESASSSYNIKNVATAVTLILKLFENNLTQLSEGWEESTSNKNWVPIESVIGKRKIQLSSAKAIKKALDKMLGKGLIENKNYWQGLEILAELYLSTE